MTNVLLSIVELLRRIVTEGFEPPTAHKQVSAPAYELRYDTAYHGHSSAKDMG